MTKITPSSATIYALAAAPNQKTTLCFAAGNMGLLRSEDGGRTWNDALQSLQLTNIPPVAAVALSPTFQSDSMVIAGTTGGVLRSIDKGQNWTFQPLGSPPPFVSTLMFSPDFERDGMLFAGTMEDGIFVSHDRGITWHAWNFGLLDLNIFDLKAAPHFAQNETLFAAVESGIFRSTNHGLAWREVPFNLDDAPILSLAISPDFQQDGILLAGTETQGLFKSEDAGRTWQRIGAESIQENVEALALAPDFTTNPYILALVGGDLLLSCDGGVSWQSRISQTSITGPVTAMLAPNNLHCQTPVLVAVANEGVQII